MKYNLNSIYEEIEKTKSIILSDPIPSWQELPTIDLYMDQVIILLNRYLRLFSANCVDGKFITPTMINNYVKLKIMPPPLKKKYGKIHLAYLIIICSLKQTLSMSTIQKIIPPTLSECEAEELYSLFVRNHNSLLNTAMEKIDEALKNDNSADKSDNINNALMQSAITSIITKLITERISDTKYE